MSVPTMRTPRSPFVRRARRSAAVPGAPEAVTRTVMSRISRAMLLGLRVDPGVDQLQERLDVEAEAERRSERDPVCDDVHEVDDRLERDVAADLAVALPRLEEGQGSLTLLGGGVLQIVHQLRIRPEAVRELEVDAEPFRALLRQQTEEPVQPFVLESVVEAVPVALDEREEERPLVGVVVEDRAAREADLLLEPGHGGAVVAVAGECASGAVQDLLAARLEMGFGDLRHASTLQNRTSVLLSRHVDAEEPLPRRDHRRRARLT